MFACRVFLDGNGRRRFRSTSTELVARVYLAKNDIKWVVYSHLGLEDQLITTGTNPCEDCELCNFK